jgi:2-polyprenyl-3-methyl-5-hydroxy-6-metoxy-1,4-benzoquinol methylase
MTTPNKYIQWQNNNIIKNSNKLDTIGSDGINKGTIYHKNTLQLLVNNGFRNTDNILDYGCGVGALFVNLKTYLDDSTLQYYGNEMSDEAYKFLKSNFADEENFILSTSDSINTFCQKKFDFIIAFSVFNHINIKRFEIFIKSLHANIHENSKIFMTVRLMNSGSHRYKTSTCKKYYNDRDLNYGYNTQAFSDILEDNNYNFEIIDTTQYYKKSILQDLKIVMITPRK